MGRSREGSIILKDGVVYARVRWTENGRRKEKAKKAQNNTHAHQLIKKMLRELDDFGANSLDHERMTFEQLLIYTSKIICNRLSMWMVERFLGCGHYTLRSTLLRFLKSNSESASCALSPMGIFLVSELRESIRQPSTKNLAQSRQ